MLDMTDLPRALDALADAFAAEAAAVAPDRARADVIRREGNQTRVMASIVRDELADDPDPQQLASAHAWLTSGTERVQIIAARRHARELRGRAL